jgi:hypothetical protein
LSLNMVQKRIPVVHLSVGDVNIDASIVVPMTAAFGCEIGARETDPVSAAPKEGGRGLKGLLHHGSWRALHRPENEVTITAHCSLRDQLSDLRHAD